MVFRIMKLEIFKEITHSYDTQEMFAMKSSLKNLTYGFPNLTAKNILEKLTNDIAQHQTYTTRLTNNFPTRLLSWLPVKLLKLTDTATTTDNGGEGGGGCLSITLTQSLLKMFSALLMTFFPLENIFKIIC